jgi:inner membrane protein
MPEGQTAPPPLPKSQPSFGKRHSTIIKLLGVGALVLVLLIPLAMITGVLRERLQRRNEAVTDITSSWGGEQNVIGPVLGIPYQYKFKVVKEVPAPDGKMERREVEENGTAIAYFLPETLHITGDVETQMLHRGIYDAAVFRAQVTLSGKFAPPDFGPLKIDVKDLQWKDAFVTIAVNDLRGTRETMVLDWGAASVRCCRARKFPDTRPAQPRRSETRNLLRAKLNFPFHSISTGAKESISRLLECRMRRI